MKRIGHKTEIKKAKRQVTADPEKAAQFHKKMTGRISLNQGEEQREDLLHR